jgi:hypothetical protein
MDLVNSRNNHDGFPFTLFAVLLFLTMVFILILVQIVQKWRAGKSILANPVSLLSKMMILVLIVSFCFIIAIDQFPCFLGVLYCD